MTLTEGCVTEFCGDVAASSTPFWGGMSTTSYKLLLVVHILAVIGAFGPTLLYAAIGREARRQGGEHGSALTQLAAKVNTKMSLPALLVASVAGMLLIADSEKVWKFSQPWVSAAFTLVLVIVALQLFVLRPAQQRLAKAIGGTSTDEAELRNARAVTGIATGLVHLAMVVTIVLMVWKPT